MKGRIMYHNTTHISFFSASSPIILLGQFFAQIPVSNITGQSPCDLRFKWLSFRTMYCLLFLICMFIHICSDFNLFIADGMTLELTGNCGVYGFFNFLTFISTLLGSIVFHCVCFVSTAVLLNLARKWRHIMTFYNAQEQVFLKFPYHFSKSNLALKLKVVCGVILFMTFCKWNLSNWNSLDPSLYLNWNHLMSRVLLSPSSNSLSNTSRFIFSL